MTRRETAQGGGAISTTTPSNSGSALKKSLIISAATAVVFSGSAVAVAAPANAIGPNISVSVPSIPVAPPAPAPVVPTKRVVATFGPSKWRGAKLVHPRGVAFNPKVLRWANLASLVMKEHKIPKRYLAGILAQIQQESGGNPNAINLWDSNAKRGTPSMGLLQIIAPTYRYYAKSGYKSVKYQAVPYTNLWASLNYAKNRYGMQKFKLWTLGQNQGY